VPLVLLEELVLQAYRVPQVNRDFKVFKDYKVYLVQPAAQGPQEEQERQGKQAPWDLLAQLEQPAAPVAQELPVNKDQLEQLVAMAGQDLQVLLGPWEYKV
jgi:hypothetical protein